MTYRRVLKLPCDDIRSGIGFKATLDAALKQLLEGLFKAGDGFKIELGDHTGGHLRAIITRGVQKIEVEGCYGQNSTFADGKKVAFVSYTVRIDGAFGTTERRESSENAEAVGKVAGVVLAVALVCAVMRSLPGKFLYWLPVYAVVVYVGRWLGARGSRIFAGATQGTGGVSSQDKSQAEAMWKRLIYSIDSVTSTYPTA